jgi:3-methyl-2-oxobutanoate hydroxymethyltransferase
MAAEPITPVDVRARKGKAPLVMMTAYDEPSAAACEAAGVDLVLVGDTAAMTTLGMPGTEAVTLDEMIALGRSVRRGLRNALMIGDLPFGSYEASDELAVATAVRLRKETGCDVVKLEGAGTSLDRARAITGAGVGVIGHLGLTPQSSSALGGFRTQARTAAAAAALVLDALALEAAGCFALVLEAIPSEVAAVVTARLSIPTIGIGAGPDCDGQVLVYNDLLGYESRVSPRFVKRYANFGALAEQAVAAFAADVRARRFPGPEHSYEMDPDEAQEFSHRVGG